MQKDSEIHDQKDLEMLACHLLFQAATAGGGNHAARFTRGIENNIVGSD